MQSHGDNVDNANFEQILTQERLITIGRLTPGILHEINNPLQAIRGALTLALDDIDKPDELREYIAISQQEIEHITSLLGHVRLIYRSQNDSPEIIPLFILFRDAIELTHEETMRQKVRVNNLLSSDSPVVEGVYNHIYIAVLRILLALIDAIGKAGGGELTVKTEDAPGHTKISFITDAPIGIQESGHGSSEPVMLIKQFDLTSSAALVGVNGGVMDFQHFEERVIVCIDFQQAI